MSTLSQGTCGPDSGSEGGNVSNVKPGNGRPWTV